MNQSTFSVGIERLWKAHSKSADQKQADVYWLALSKMSDQQFEHAVGRSIEIDETFPRVPRLWIYAKEIRVVVAANTSPFFSFLHEECALPFSVRVTDLNAEKWIVCDACKHYSQKHIRWNGEFLRRKMEEAKPVNSDLAILESPLVGI